MAVNWYWKIKLGEVHYFDEKHKVHFKLDMYGGNMMCCFIYNFVETNEETKQPQKMYNFITWFNDIAHAKRVLKNDKDFFRKLLIGKPKFRKIKLKVHDKKDPTYIGYKEMLQFGKLMAEYGYKVELY